MLTFLDVTGTVKAESALRESEARLRTLLAELQHRARNTLAVVKSITTRTAERSETVEDMAAHLGGRLDAFARVQAAVTRAPDAGIDLAGLVGDEMRAHAVREGEQLSIDGPTVALPHKAGESLSLALHELATNAVKHGALGSPDGRIAVRWRIKGTDGTRRLLLSWEEGGNGGIEEPAREGFGMELLKRILPYDLAAKSKVEFTGEGLRFTLDMPLGDGPDAAET